jgi:hypothetical protein
VIRSRFADYLSVEWLDTHPKRNRARSPVHTVGRKEPAELRPDRSVRQAEPLRDLLIGKAGGDQVEDLRLSRCHACPVQLPGVHETTDTASSNSRQKNRQWGQDWPVIVNVCPAATTSAPPERVWSVLTAPERFGEWMDARFVSAEPPGPVQAGQVINLSAPSLGRHWPVRIDVRGVDPQHRWLDLVVHVPFGIENHERVTLTEMKGGGTLVRFN